MRTVLQDLQYGLRTFRRNPGFTLTIVLVLTLGISGTATIFTVFYGVILQPLPLRNPDRLVMIGAPAPPDGDSLDWWSQSRALASLCEYRSGGVNLGEGEWPTRVSAAMVSASFFSVFEISPQRGRPFIADDEILGKNQVALVSDRLWKQNFGHDPNIIGRDITLDGIRHTIVGIMPAGFGYPGQTDVWVPRAVGGGSLYLGDDEQSNWPTALRHTLVGRLRPEISLTQARSELHTLFRRLEETYAASQVQFGSGVQVIPLQEALVENFRPALLALLAGAGFLLLTACANSANLMLARAVTRQQELAIRLCLGATPWRVMRQLLTEAVLLAVVSGSLSIVVAHWGAEVVRAVGPRDVPRLAEVHVSPVVLGFALGVSLLAGIFVGVAPAIQAFTPSPVELLKQGGARAMTGFRLRFRQILVMVVIVSNNVLGNATGKSFLLTRGVRAGRPRGLGHPLA
ncbi:MAG: ABC transporter permease, partial [Acidobacteriota bacterium]|nr:ABC transporter permease [Acidobacteriota bacterium]